MVEAVVSNIDHHIYLEPISRDLSKGLIFLIRGGFKSSQFLIYVKAQLYT